MAEVSRISSNIAESTVSRAQYAKQSSSFTLPKDYSGSPQAPYSPNISPKQPNTAENLRKEIEQIEREFLQILMQSFKNQGIDPDKTSKASEVAQTRAAIASAVASFRAAIAATDLKEMFQRNNILQNEGLQGQKVSWDDSKRTFNGKPITFNYTVKYPDGRLPENASVSAMLIVYDANKKEVFRTTKGVDIKNGKNSFVWNGKDTDGKELEKGEYSVEVKLHYTDLNGNRVKVPIETSLSGIVDAIESDGKLIVDGQIVDVASITRLERSVESNKKEPIPLRYLKQSAHIKCNTFEVQRGDAVVELVCVAPTKVSEITMYVYDQDSGKNVATMKRKVSFEEGYNKFTYDLVSDAETKSKLPIGNYVYQIMAKPVDSDEIIAIDNELDVTITAIDSDYIFDEYNRQFKLDDIVRFNAGNTNTSSNPVAEGSQYMGKNVTFDNNMFTLQDVGVAEEYISIPKPPDGMTLGDAELLVYDANNKVIHKEVYKAATLYHAEIESVDYDSLDTDSSEVIDKIISEYKEKHDDKRTADELIQSWITGLFRQGKIFKNGQDSKDPNVILRNTGMVAIAWDGYDDTEHKKCPPGTYRFELKTTNIHNGQTIKCPPLNLELTSRVLGFDASAGNVQLRTESGRIIDPSRVKNISF